MTPPSILTEIGKSEIFTAKSSNCNTGLQIGRHLQKLAGLASLAKIKVDQCSIRASKPQLILVGELACWGRGQSGQLPFQLQSITFLWPVPKRATSSVNYSNSPKCYRTAHNPLMYQKI